jgi:NTE family protein
MDPSAARQIYQDELVARYLRAFLGEIDPPVMEILRRQLQWVEIAGGETLMTEGEPGDSMYWTISGRLRAYVRSDDGSQRMVREMGRGNSIGELSLFTGEPRAATVVALRNSVLVRLPKSDFDLLLASSSQLAIALTRQIIGHLRNTHSRSVLERPVVIGLLPITCGVDQREFGNRLAAHLRRNGRVRIVDAAAADHDLQQAGIANSESDDTDTSRRIALLLEEIEAANDFVLLLGDDGPTPWTQRVSRHCDELLLLADATQPPALHAIEEQCLIRRPAHTEAAEIIVLLHAADVHSPRSTRQWLDRRPVTDHIHIRPALERDMARLARMQSRTAVGLVLAGGGARGFAHLGVYRALQEHGIEIDCVGGTSIGAAMATCVASDQPLDLVMAGARRAFAVNPTGDFNFFPLLSLIKGRRLRSILENAVQHLLGFDADVEDLWKNYYCVATNYSQAREQVLRRGNLVRSMLASLAIPGALPPVVRDGDLMCDGGTFNNFPVDVMLNRRGIGRVIGVDLDFRKTRRLEIDEVPGSWALLRDRFRPRKKRRFHLPSMMSYLLNVTILYSMSRQSEAQRMTDVYFNPPLDRVGLLEWDKFDQIVLQGHAHAVEVLQRYASAPGPRDAGSKKVVEDLVS